MKMWKDLTESEKDSFAEKFYELWKKEFDFETDLQDNPYPYGTPWYWNPEGEAVSAECFFEQYKDEISSLNKEILQ